MDQKFINKTLEFIAENGYTKDYQVFLKNTSLFLAELLNVKYVLISKYSLNKPNEIKSVAYYGKNEAKNNITYLIAGTPCENVLGNKLQIYPNNVQNLFPIDRTLVEMKVESYIGIPLWNSIKEPIGLISILDTNPLENYKTLELVLKIISVKVEKILEKILYDNILKIKINDLKKSKLKAEENEYKFKKLSDLSFEGILIHDMGIAIDSNLSFKRMFGYSREEIIGKDITKIIYPKKQHKIISKNRRNQYNLPFETEGIRKDGSVFPIEIETRSISTKNYKDLSVSAFRDITKRKKSEVENKKLSAAVEQSANAIIITDLNGIIQYTNPKFSEYTGYKANEIIGKHPRVLNSGRQSIIDFSQMWKVITSGEIWSGQFENRSKKGDIFWVQATITPIKNELGEITNYLGIQEDITIRKKAEEDLNSAYETIKEKENYLYKILQTANEGFWIIDKNQQTIQVNKEMCRILDYDESELLGKPIYDFVDLENKEVFKKQMEKRSLGLATSYEISLQKKDGQNVPCLFNTSVIFDNDNNQTGSLALVTDISQLKGTYQKLEAKNIELKKLSFELSEKNRLHLESNYRFKNLFELSPISLWEEDYSSAIKLLNTKKEEVEDLNLFLEENPDFVMQCVLEIKIISVNRNTLDLFLVENKEELLAQLRKTIDKKAIEVLKNELIAVVSNENEFRTVAEYTRKDGEKITAILKLAKIDNEGKVIVSLTDITALKKAERELIIAKEEAEESDRLKTEFLNNMSHEIRTPMNGILGFSQMLNEPNLDAIKRNNFINIIKNSGNQLLHIIDDILEISKLGTKQVKTAAEEVCLNDLLLELFSIFDIKAKENKTPLYLIKGLSDKQSTIISDKIKLNKILSNLLENALKFTSNGFIEFGYDLKKNNEIQELEIYIRDTGIGIKEEYHEKIFERFTQAEKDLTKKVGGLGLGLSIAKENTELIGGKISVKSIEKSGATFYVTIPFVPVYSDLINVESKDKYRILIAEDEEVNFMYLETILNDTMKLNCDIIHSKNGQEAVEFCEKNSNIDIILMDLKMPVLNGFKATSQIKELSPDLPIIAQTAYSTAEDKKKAINAGCDAFISKPINKEILYEVLNKYLIKNTSCVEKEIIGIKK